MKGKVDDVSALFQGHGLQILALNETWHEGYDTGAIKRLRGMGFTVLEEARPRSSQVSEDSIRWSNNDGIAVVARQGLRLTKVSIGLSFKTFEYMCCRVSSGGASFTHVIVYRPGSENITYAFHKEIQSLLERTDSFSGPLYITGDVNIHLEKIIRMVTDWNLTGYWRMLVPRNGCPVLHTMMMERWM